MRKNRIRLTETQLQRVIKESVRNVLNEDRYQDNLVIMSKQLAEQIRIFLQTLSRAYPSDRPVVANYREDLQTHLMSAMYGLEDIYERPNEDNIVDY